MRFKGKHIFLLLAISLVTTGATSAYADTPQAPATDSNKISKEQYKKEKDSYIEAIRERDFKFRTINMNFKLAMDKASADYKDAVLEATSPEQKTSARTAYIAARTQAIAKRDLAILNLGPAPVPPAENSRSGKNEYLQRNK